MEERVIPPNLHFKTPNPDIAGLLDGRLKVVTECTRWNGGLVAMNSFGFGGSNVHAVYRYTSNHTSFLPSCMFQLIMFYGIYVLGNEITFVPFIHLIVDFPPNVHIFY